MYQILESAAKNEGSSGTLMGAGMGLGMGVGLGAPMGRAFGDIAGSAFGSPQQPQTPGVSDEPITPIKSNGGENINVQDFFVKKEGQVQTDKRICGQCGNEVLPNALFCSHCGSKLGKKCKNCGHDLGADVRFCPNCGTKAE